MIQSPLNIAISWGSEDSKHEHFRECDSSYSNIVGADRVEGRVLMNVTGVLIK